jgi:hypothetical protein
VPGDLLNLVGTGVGFGPDDIKAAIHGPQAKSRIALSDLLQGSAYLLGEQPTLADFASRSGNHVHQVPRQSDMLICQAGICGKGVPGLADVPEFEPFFAWRDSLYDEYRVVQRVATPGPGNAGSGPTPISID